MKTIKKTSLACSEPGKRLIAKNMVDCEKNSDMFFVGSPLKLRGTWTTRSSFKSRSTWTTRSP